MIWARSERVAPMVTNVDTFPRTYLCPSTPAGVSSPATIAARSRSTNRLFCCSSCLRRSVSTAAANSYGDGPPTIAFLANTGPSARSVKKHNRQSSRRASSNCLATGRAGFTDRPHPVILSRSYEQAEGWPARRRFQKSQEAAPPRSARKKTAAAGAALRLSLRDQWCSFLFSSLFHLTRLRGQLQYSCLLTF